LDSALGYFEWVSQEYKGTSREERALYSIAGIYQKRNSAAWKELLEDTYNRFPDGEYAFMARKLLGYDNVYVNLLAASLEESEREMVDGSMNGQTIARLQTLAASDSLRLKERALYDLGMIHEKFQHEPDTAFAYYYALMLMSPQSDLARHVRPKVDSYLKEKQLDETSATHRIDPRYYTAPHHATADSTVEPVTVDTVMVLSDSMKIMMDTTSTDTVTVKKYFDDEEDLKGRPVKHPKKRLKEKEAVRKDDIDE